jgi:hypothetical protein
VEAAFFIAYEPFTLKTFTIAPFSVTYFSLFYHLGTSCSWICFILNSIVRGAPDSFSSVIYNYLNFGANSAINRLLSASICVNLRPI